MGDIVRPLLPSADKLLPYLQRIDASRHYTNFGGLNSEFQERLEVLFGAPCITGSSATSLITAVLMSYDLPHGSLVAMPSWTFPATAAAVVSAGLNPYFVDVDHEGVIGKILYPVSAMIVVSPFGRPLDMTGFNGLEIPVIIDAAAGFDAFSTVCKPQKNPVIISTHATKSFGTGEGGFITCHDNDLLEKVRRITNFGFTPERNIEHTGLNAKLSEYHAAVGLAGIDGWGQKRKLLLEQTKKFGIDYAITQIPVSVSDYPDAKKGSYGVHTHPAYSKYPRNDLPVTEKLMMNKGTIMV